MKRIISIGTDKKILENGRVFDRVKEYASLIEGDYFCYIFNAENMKKQDNFHAMGLGKKNKFLQIITLVRELRKLKINASDILYPRVSAMVLRQLKYGRFRGRSCAALLWRDRLKNGRQERGGSTRDPAIQSRRPHEQKPQLGG